MHAAAAAATLAGALALFATAAAAQKADPMNSAECAAARKALAAAESAPGGPAAAEGGMHRYLWLRNRAAQACLGESVGTTPPRTRVQPPPISLPRTGVQPLPALPPAAPPAPPPAAAGNERREVWVTSCDAAGCWGSDGKRYPRYSGSLLIGPHGMCAMQGPVLSCP